MAAKHFRAGGSAEQEGERTATSFRDGPDSVASHLWAVLESIYDPCSLSAPVPVSIVDLGIVRSVTVDEAGNVEIVIGTTSPACALCPSIVWRGVEEAVTRVPGVRSATVTVDTDFCWTPAEMTTRALEALDSGRRSMEAKGFSPQAWRQPDAASPRTLQPSSSSPPSKAGQISHSDTHAEGVA